MWLRRAIAYALRDPCPLRVHMRAPAVIRWPGHIEPGTVFDDIFSSLDWLPTFVDIASGPSGDGLPYIYDWNLLPIGSYCG